MMNYEISPAVRRRALAELELRKRVSEEILECWRPLPGPQTQAYESKADILLFGGSAGGGKSDLILGVAKEYDRSIIFRREYPQLEAIIDRSHEVFDDIGSYNGSKKKWSFYNGRNLQFGSVKDQKDVKKYMGRAHSFKGFDEITHFTEAQFRFLIGWTRTTDKNQRTRIICAGNPPLSVAERWVIRFWAPWLDEKYPYPAKPGELRWFTTVGNEDKEVESGDPFEHNGELIIPKSRTFIPAKVEDNPYLMESGYKSTLQALPEPLRSILLYGDFKAGIEDDIWQVIPTAWVQRAQQRWREQQKPTDIPMTSLGIDVARGGRDRTVLTERYGHYFCKQHMYPGKSTPDGQHVAMLALKHIRDEAVANIDVIGVGSSAYDFIKGSWDNTVALNASEKSTAKDKAKRLTFVNLRAEMWWKLREALDPDTGDDLALPDDGELLSDLCAPTWKLTVRGIQILDKEEIIKNIGRSPDKGESLLYAFTIKPMRQARATII